MNQILARLEDAPLLHRQIACDLLHPLLVGMSGDDRNVNLSGVELDEEKPIKRDQSAQRPQSIVGRLVDHLGKALLALARGYQLETSPVETALSDLQRRLKALSWCSSRRAGRYSVP